MKKQLIILSLAFLVVSCNKNESNLHITGNIKGLNKGTLYIQKIVDTLLVPIDTIRIDGKPIFESHLKIDSPEMYYLFLDRGVTNSLDNNIPFFAEAGEISIQTSLENYLSDAKITGSKNHDKFEEYKMVNTRYTDKNLDLVQMQFKALQNKEYAKADSITKEQDLVTKRRYLYAVNFALNNKDYEVAPFIALSEIPDVNLKYLDTIQKMMTPKVAKSMYGKKLKEFYKNRLGKGF